MHLKEHVLRMAEYNQWMNEKVYTACKKLTPHQIIENRKAFFGSVLGTLNHLLVADIIWLKRISMALNSYSALEAVAEIPMPASLDTILYADLNTLWSQRERLDWLFLSFTQAVTEEDLLQPINYKNMKGLEFNRKPFNLLMHIFNHQTHHRGQITTLLSQFNVDAGTTDLLELLPND